VKANINISLLVLDLSSSFLPQQHSTPKTLLFLSKYQHLQGPQTSSQLFAFFTQTIHIMLVSFTHLVAILASVTLALSAGLPPVARTSSEITTSGSLSAPKANVAVARGEDIYSDDDFIGTPEEIYIKVKARRDSLGLDLPARSNSSLEARDQVSSPPFLLLKSLFSFSDL
jgi:hypothetical protein